MKCRILGCDEDVFGRHYCAGHGITFACEACQSDESDYEIDGVRICSACLGSGRLKEVKQRKQIKRPSEIYSFGELFRALIEKVFKI